MAGAAAASGLGEEQLGSFVANSGAPIMVIAEDGETLFLNEGFTAATGCGRDEVVRLADWLAASAAVGYLTRVQRFIADAFGGGDCSRSCETTITAHDGTLRQWSLTAAAPLRFADGRRYCVVTGRDVTEQRNAEQALRVSRAESVAQHEELESLYNEAPVGLCLFDPGLRFVRINDFLADINGLPVADHLGRTVREVVPHLADAAEPLLRRVFADGLPLRNMLISGITAKEPGLVRHWREDFYPVKDADGQVRAVGAIVFDVTDQKRYEAELRERDERLQAALAVSRTGTFRWTLGSDRVEADNSLHRLLQLPPEQTFSRLDEMLDCVHAEDRADFEAALRQAGAVGSGVVRDFRLPPASTGVRWITARCQAFVDEDGRPTYVTGACVDITERKETEERLTLVVAELNHRVRNSLATVQAIAMQTLRDDRSPAAACDAFVGRLHALADAHTLLADAEWQGADVRDVVRKILAPYGADDDDGVDAAPARVRLRGQGIRLTPRATVCLGMVLHELAANAVKHGALSEAQGHAAVTWSLAEDAGTVALSLSWTEAGGPRVQPPVRDGFGLTFIRRSVMHDLCGTTEADFAPEGLAYRIQFPAAGAVRPA